MPYILYAEVMHTQLVHASPIFVEEPVKTWKPGAPQILDMIQSLLHPLIIQKLVICIELENLWNYYTYNSREKMQENVREAFPDLLKDSSVKL